MPRANTKPELALWRELHSRGARFRVHIRTLPARPDNALTRARLAVLMEGCFWRRWALHGMMPKKNADWWAAELNGNVERDRRKDAELAMLGWTPLHVWEDEPVAEAADRVEGLWRTTTRRESPRRCERTRETLEHDDKSEGSTW